MARTPSYRNEPEYESKPTMSLKKIFAIVASAIICILLLFFIFTMFEFNNASDYQIVQGLNGNVRVQDDSGLYCTWGGKPLTWPRARQFNWGKSENETIRVTFNDGGTATLSGTIRYRLPVTEESRRVVNREFTGNYENVDRAILSHLINCIKVSGPVMSSSENQSARKAEFNYLVHEQLQNGLFQSRKITEVSKDQTDTNGQPITVDTTEIVKDETGKPIVQQTSPFKEYGIEILQLSIEDTEYDPLTIAQFETKKKSFQAAEAFKAQREQEVQSRLMTIEKGLREKAEVSAEANKEAELRAKGDDNGTR